MQLAPPIFRRRRRLRSRIDETGPGAGSSGARVGLPLYLGGTRKNRGRNFGSISLGGPESGRDAEIDLGKTEELPTLSGQGTPSHAVAYGLALRGRTDADFGNDFSTENGRTSPATKCPNCEDGECVRATGLLISNFNVATTVTLPSVDDFPDLTPCQRQRVQSAISGVLAPHEQRHVRAFRTYNGTVRTPFNLKVCRDDFDARIQEMHDGIAAIRQARAQARSDALDPFNFEVDLDCQDAPGSSGAGGAPRPTAAGQ